MKSNPKGLLDICFSTEEAQEGKKHIIQLLTSTLTACVYMAHSEKKCDLKMT